MSTVPMFAPDGTLGDVPYEHMKDALAAGGKPGVTIKSPDGKVGVVPADRYQEAAKAGGTIVPIENQETQHPGFWAQAADMLSGVLHPHGFSPYPGTDQDAKAAASGEAYEQDQDRQKPGIGLPEGRGLAYRLGAPIAQAAGADVPGMEEHAAAGDEAGVWARAAVPIAFLGAGEAAAHLVPPIMEKVGSGLSKTAEAARNLTPKQAAQGVGGVGGAVAGHGPLSVPGAYYGAKTGGRIAESILGKERANAPIIARPPVEAPPVEAPPVEASPEVASPEPAAPTASPESRLPEAFQPPARPPAVPGTADAPFRAPAQVEPRKVPDLPAAFQPLPKKAPPVPGTADAPFKSLAELPAQSVHQALTEMGPKASIEDVTARANEIAWAGIPRTLSGDSALTQILTGQDNANLLKIAKSRGINVAKESQLKPGVADQLLIKKIQADMSPEELDEIGARYLENQRMGGHQFGDVGPEAWKAMSLQTYFPDVKIPAAVLKRTGKAIAANGPEAAPEAPTISTEKAPEPTPQSASPEVPAEPVSGAKEAQAPAKGADTPSAEGDLTDILQKSVEQAKAAKANGAPRGIQGALKEIENKFPTNPNNPGAGTEPKELALMGKDGPEATLTIAERGGKLRLKGIQSLKAGTGAGSRTLRALTDIADKHGVDMELTASPYGDEATRLDKDSLTQWYERHGFEFEKGKDPAYGYMVRKPQIQ